MDYSKTSNKLEILEQGKTYHIYNKAISHEKLFITEKDYFYFLKKLHRYILPVAHIIAYCLIPNHFHLLVTIKEIEEIPGIQENDTANQTGIISKSFSNFFNSYTRSFNIAYNRKGRLFLYPFKRILVDDDDYFVCLMNYIHRNPVHHGLTEDYDQWKYSSYNAYLSERPTHVNRKEGLSYFDSLDEFILFHKENKTFPDVDKYYLE
jgi:REP element-mobilizing transposase RayT